MAAQWLESWFTWIFGIPGTAAEFPLMDTTGASSVANQSGTVFFLAKSWVGKKGNPPEQRTASVPEGTALFMNWRSQASATYGIKASNDFANWTDLANGLPGDPTRTRWSEPLMSPGQPARFYRIVEETKSIEGLWVAINHGDQLSFTWTGLGTHVFRRVD